MSNEPPFVCVTIDQVAEAVSEVYKPEGVTIWLDAPNKWLHNATPRQYVAAGDGDKLVACVICGTFDALDDVAWSAHCRHPRSSRGLRTVARLPENPMPTNERDQ